MRLSTLLLAFLLVGGLTGCDESSTTGPEDDGSTDVPTAYTFESRFAEGESSVSYPGQVVRNLLMQDLKTLTDGVGKTGATAVTEADLLAYYDHDDAGGMETITSTTPAPARTQYSTISPGKELADRVTSQYAGQTLFGAGVTPDALIRSYLREIAARSQTDALGTPAAHTTDAGVDMSQIVNKVLFGAVSYSQAVDKYLTLIETDDNASPSSEGAAYSAMEHHWDEAFGYFGAARDYLSYSDAALAGSDYYRDSDGNGTVEFVSEYNFPVARYAGKRDVAAEGVNFSKEIFEAFVTGRALIAEQASLAQILEQRDIIRTSWEKLYAANIVHYINSTIEDMGTLTSEEIAANNNEALNEHWSEAKGFAYALQFNPARSITDADLQSLHTLLGDAPTYAEPGSDAAKAARSDLEQARTLLQTTYGFSDVNVQNW